LRRHAGEALSLVQAAELALAATARLARAGAGRTRGRSLRKADRALTLTPAPSLKGTGPSPTRPGSRSLRASTPTYDLDTPYPLRLYTIYLAD
jgi:hypothetical protein